MVNYEIQYTGKFDMLTYFFGTNSVVVLSPDCICIFHPQNTHTPELAHELHLKSLVGIHDSLKCFIYHSVERFIRSFS